MKITKYLSYFAITTACITTPGLANDGAVQIIGGDIVLDKAPDISMESERLDISRHQVRVAYVFKNNTDKDIAITVGFPVLIDEGMWDHKQARTTNPLSFTATVNGQPVNFETRETNNPDTAETTFWHHWQQNFSAGESTTIEHQYQPVLDAGILYGLPADNVWSDAIGEASVYGQILESHCASQKHINKARERGWEVKTLNYILRTARTWDGPVKDFKLTIHKDGAPMVFFCTDLPLRKDSASNAFVAEVKNYLPTTDLSIAYVDNYDY